MTETPAYHYTFLVENIIKFKIIEHIDELRVRSEDDKCSYVFYIKDCYPNIESAMDGMYKFLAWVKATKGKQYD